MSGRPSAYPPLGHHQHRERDQVGERVGQRAPRELTGAAEDRVEHLQSCTERLEFRKENIFRLDARKDLKDIIQKITRATEKREDLITVSADLRKRGGFGHMKDEQIFRLSKFAHVEGYLAGDYVFREEDRSMDFYVVKDGAVIAWESAGSAGFKGSRKSTPFAAQVTADSCAKKGMEHGLQKVEVFVKGPGSGRETAIRSLQAAGLEVLGVRDVSPQAHNGVRPKKRRRV